MQTRDAVFYCLNDDRFKYPSPSSLSPAIPPPQLTPLCTVNNDWLFSLTTTIVLLCQALTSSMWHSMNSFLLPSLEVKSSEDWCLKWSEKRFLVNSKNTYLLEVFYPCLFQLFGKIKLDPDSQINEDNHFRNLLQALQVLFRLETIMSLRRCKNL